ncbi:MAG: hypothetical protein ACP5MZ_02490 [Candidatus Micrarchaeia archaeon]
MEAKNIDNAGAKNRAAKSSSAKKSTARSAKKNNATKTSELQQKEGISRQAIAVIAIIIIFVAVFSSLFYGLVSYKPTSFSTFANNFNKANSVAIYVNYTNGTTFAPELSCSNALIEELTSSVKDHKNASQINFYVLYNNSCIYRQGALGTLISNYTNATRSECISYGANKPSIFINYSSVNRTVITPSKLYFSGDANFLDECGIAYQIT